MREVKCTLMYAFQRQNAGGLGVQEGSGEKKGCFGGWFYTGKWDSLPDKYSDIPACVPGLSDLNFPDSIRAFYGLRLTFALDRLGQIREKLGLMFSEFDVMSSDWLDSVIYGL